MILPQNENKSITNDNKITVIQHFVSLFIGNIILNLFNCLQVSLELLGTFTGNILTLHIENIKPTRT